MEVGKAFFCFFKFKFFRFTGELVGLKYYNAEKDLCRLMHVKRIVELPIQRYFNDGVGKFYFLNGVKQKVLFGKKEKYYNNLNEFDCNFGYYYKKNQNIIENLLLSSNFCIEINENSGWNGSTSLKITG